jgi:hypothetical protein
MQLFEFEDFRWFPGSLRESLTLYISALHRLMRTDRLLVPLLARALREVGDGAVSNARTYTTGDLRELLRGLEAPDYQWEMETVRAPGAPGRMLYLLGLPRTGGTDGSPEAGRQAD